jgi:hypothetical protein
MYRPLGFNVVVGHPWISLGPPADGSIIGVLICFAGESRHMYHSRSAVLFDFGMLRNIMVREGLPGLYQVLQHLVAVVPAFAVMF